MGNLKRFGSIENSTGLFRCIFPEPATPWSMCPSPAQAVRDVKLPLEHCSWATLQFSVYSVRLIKMSKVSGDRKLSMQTLRKTSNMRRNTKLKLSRPFCSAVVFVAFVRKNIEHGLDVYAATTTSSNLMISLIIIICCVLLSIMPSGKKLTHSQACARAP